MAIEYTEDRGIGGGVVRTVACPFCGAAIEGRSYELPTHLSRDCEEMR